MSPRTRPSLRKKPRQERSKATVELILEAAAHILVSSGYDGTTTKHVAERAGVSIGSFYQYFPSKESLVATLIERQQQRVLGLLSERLRPHSIDEPELEVLAVVRALVEVYADNPALQRVLLEAGARVGMQQSTRELESRVESLVQGTLARDLPLDRPRNLGLVVFIITRAVRGAVWTAVLERPELIGTPELVEELGELVVGYLRPRPRAPGG